MLGLANYFHSSPYIHIDEQFMSTLQTFSPLTAAALNVNLAVSTALVAVVAHRVAVLVLMFAIPVTIAPVALYAPVASPIAERADFGYPIVYYGHFELLSPYLARNDICHSTACFYGQYYNIRESQDLSSRDSLFSN